MDNCCTASDITIFKNSLKTNTCNLCMDTSCYLCVQMHLTKIMSRTDWNGVKPNASLDNFKPVNDQIMTSLVIQKTAIMFQNTANSRTIQEKCALDPSVRSGTSLGWCNWCNETPTPERDREWAEGKSWQGFGPFTITCTALRTALIKPITSSRTSSTLSEDIKKDVINPGNNKKWR